MRKTLCGCSSHRWTPNELTSIRSGHRPGKSDRAMIDIVSAIWALSDLSAAVDSAIIAGTRSALNVALSASWMGASSYTEIGQSYRKEVYLLLTSSHLDLIAFFRYTDPARRTERSWEESSTMRRRFGRNKACVLRVVRLCSACFLVGGFNDANSS